MRQGGEQSHEEEDAGRHETPPAGAADGARSGRPLDRRVERGFAEREFPGEVHRAGEEQHDHHERIRNRVALELHDPVEDLDRSHPVVAEHERGAELREAPDQHDAAAGQDAGFHEREGDAPEPLPPRCAEIPRRLVERRVEVAERGDQIQIEDRVQMQRFDEADRPEPAAAAEEIDRRSPQPVRIVLTTP